MDLIVRPVTSHIHNETNAAHWSAAVLSASPWGALPPQAITVHDKVTIEVIIVLN